MKKLAIVLLIGLSLFVITGCEKKEKKVKEKAGEQEYDIADVDMVVSDGKKVDTSKMKHKHCTRDGSLDDGKANLYYDLYYNGNKLHLLRSVESVESEDSTVLDTYQEAYVNIHKKYEGLQYYDALVTKAATVVTSIMVINYDKIDMDALLKIEGEEDNIIENGEAKVDKWLELASKFGTKCEEYED